MVHKRYITQRGATYYFRWRVPTDLRPFLGLSEIKRSLQTDSYRCAFGRCAVAFAVIDEILGAYSAFTNGRLFASQLVSTLDGLKTSLGSPSGITLTPPIVPPPLVADSSPPISDVVTLFLEHKRNAKFTQRMLKEYAVYFEVVVAVIGEQPIASVTSKDILSLLQAYSKLPRRNLGEYKKIPVKTLLAMDIPQEHRVSVKTVEQVKKMLQSFYVFAIHELEIVKTSPVNNLKLNLSTARTYAVYSDAEVICMLARVNESKHTWHKWVLLLGVYTGARRSELVQLHSDNVKYDADTCRHYLLINEDFGRLKTENAIRQIPLHMELINAGFLQFVSSAKGALFPNLKPHQVTTWFFQYRVSCGISSHDDFGNRKAFHSLRHTLITKARAAGVSVTKVQQVVGHERVSFGITDRYTHRFPLVDTLIVIDSIRFASSEKL